MNTYLKWIRVEEKPGRESVLSLLFSSLRNFTALTLSLLHQIDKLVGYNFAEKGTLSSDKVGISQRRLGRTVGITWISAFKVKGAKINRRHMERSLALLLLFLLSLSEIRGERER